MEQAYPLSWPRGYQRTAPHQRKTANFRGAQRRITTAEACERVITQVERFSPGRFNTRTRELVISTNVQPTLSGRPRSQTEPADPGAAVYFVLDDEPKVFCCDKWDRLADNLAAIANTIDALRGISRWGVTEDKQVFSGFSALPAPGDVQARTCWNVLEIPPTASRAVIDSAYKRRAKICHPDLGGSHEAMTELATARDQALNQATQA